MRRHPIIKGVHSFFICIKLISILKLRYLKKQAYTKHIFQLFQPRMLIKKKEYSLFKVPKHHSRIFIEGFAKHFANKTNLVFKNLIANVISGLEFKLKRYLKLVVFADRAYFCVLFSDLEG